MKHDVVFKIPTPSSSLCQSLVDAVEPDNALVPPGISISMKCENGILIVEVVAENTPILTIRNTVDDLLVHIGLALKTVSMTIGADEGRKTFKPSQEGNEELV